LAGGGQHHDGRAAIGLARNPRYDRGGGSQVRRLAAGTFHRSYAEGVAGASRSCNRNGIEMGYVEDARPHRARTAGSERHGLAHRGQTAAWSDSVAESSGGDWTWIAPRAPGAGLRHEQPYSGGAYGTLLSDGGGRG